MDQQIAELKRLQGITDMPECKELLEQEIQRIIALGGRAPPTAAPSSAETADANPPVPTEKEASPVATAASGGREDNPFAKRDKIKHDEPTASSSRVVAGPGAAVEDVGGAAPVGARAASLREDGDLSCTEYSFLDDGQYAKVYVAHPGVGKLDKKYVQSAFGATSFELRIADGDRQPLHLSIPNLCYDIVPGKSQVKVKANKVIVAMQKRDMSKTWEELTDRKVKAEAERRRRIDHGDLKGADTMDLLRDLYEKSDDEGRQGLMKAYTEGEEKRNAHRMGW